MIFSWLQGSGCMCATSVGELVSTILTKYSQWDRYTEKFDMITFRQETLRAILEATDDETLIRKFTATIAYFY